jgi:mannosyltransferase
LDNLVLKALAKRAAERYPSMEDLREDLEAIGGGLRPVRAGHRILRRIRSVGPAWTLGAALAVQASLPALKKSADGASIVLFSSLATSQGFSLHASVGMAKGGDEAFLDGLKAEVAAAGLTGRILFPGEVAAERMPALMQGAGLLMALPRYEGYGVTPIEAMACGVPIIASRTGHFQEFAGRAGGNDQAGLVVPLEDWEGAAEAAVALLSDAPRHAAWAAAARERAVRLFGVEREAAGIRAVYEEIWAGA